VLGGIERRDWTGGVIVAPLGRLRCWVNPRCVGAVVAAADRV